MDKIVVEGGARLTGKIPISGAKNAALPLLAAALLPTGASTFKNVPQLADVRTMAKLLRMLGWEVDTIGLTQLAIAPGADSARKLEAPYELVKTMRASVLVLGPLVARHRRARVSLPGGCAIGARPIDQHLKGLEALGAEIRLQGGYVEAHARRLRGATFTFDLNTVTGTENLLMAATLADGQTVLENAAREPEVEELARVLNKMGARVSGAGTDIIRVEGVDSLHPVEHAILPDRIEAGTLLVAAAITGGDILVKNALAERLDAVIQKLRAAGCQIAAAAGGLRCKGPGDIH